MNKIAYKIRQKIKKEKQEKLKKDGIQRTCPLCERMLRIMPDNVVYTVGEKPVHPGCFFRYTEKNNGNND